MSRPDTDKDLSLDALVHKLNQPLTAIGNYAQAGATLLAGGSVDHATLAALFGKILEQARRGVAISRELGELARQQREGGEG